MIALYLSALLVATPISVTQLIPLENHEYALPTVNGMWYYLYIRNRGHYGEVRWIELSERNPRELGHRLVFDKPNYIYLGLQPRYGDTVAELTQPFAIGLLQLNGVPCPF